MSYASVTVIGAGLAGSEAAWQVAQRGLHVDLYEMRPVRRTPAHQTGNMAELVCSNSLGSKLPDRALGLLKDEMRSLGSLIVACAERCALPAGDALAVSRDDFSQAVTDAIQGHARITVHRQELTELPGGSPLIVATGPLTSPDLAQAIRNLAGQDYLYFFDAMAPIVTAESINMQIAFRASRWQKRKEPVDLTLPDAGPRPLSPEPAEGDYINCPMNREQYYAFVDAVNAAEKISLREFEQEDEARRYFEGCLPIEVLAARERDALAYGPMRPVGLWDPRTGKRPAAVVQLRQDNVAGTLYNLVGFQTNIKWGDQERVLRMIPGLEEAEFVRFGQMHRNTFINSPALLHPTLEWHDRPGMFCAGQLTGTEGYVGSAAGGLLAGLNAARAAFGQEPVTLPPTTMMGALFHYITHAETASFQPMKANFGLMPPLETEIRGKRERGAAYAERSLRDLAPILAQVSPVAQPMP